MKIVFVSEVMRPGAVRLRLYSVQDESGHFVYGPASYEMCQEWLKARSR